MKRIPTRGFAAVALAIAATTYPWAQTAQSLPVTSPVQDKTHAQKNSLATDPYRDEPFVFETYDTTTRMKADGTGDVVQHVILRVQTDGVARQFSVLNLSYASANSTGTMDFVRVHKPDGRTVNTPVDEAMEMPAEVSREAPMYSDVKEKHLPVRGLGTGDRLEYQFHTTLTKAQAPGQFWGAEHFQVQAGVVLNETYTLQVPETTYVQVWSPNHPASPVVKDGMKTWTWTSSQTKPSARDENGRMTAADVKDPDEDADGRKLPSVAWTTFHSWAEVGDWYRSLAKERLQPTATVRAKADALTKDAKTPQEQAETLYRFVATQIRYISISFGVGRFQPHTPDEVLDHGYGDCKDKDTLLEAMLRAKGLTTAPVLIGAGIAPVADVPSPAVFNHVITTVELPGAGGKPERTWLDSTAEVAPFRVLLPLIRDQNALLIPDKAPAALEKTPADPPFPYAEDFAAVATLDKNGLLKGHMQMSVRSDTEYGLRVMLQRIAPAQWDQSMQYLSGAMGFGGKVANADFHQADPSGPVHLSYDYTREDFADWKENRIIPLFPYLEVVVIDKDKAPDHDINLGWPRTLHASTSITLPTGEGVQLPDAVHVKRPYATFDKTYQVANGTVTATRTTVVLQHKVPKDQWKDYLAFTKAIGMDDGEPWIILFDPSPPRTSAATTAVVGGFPYATAQAAMTEVSSLEKLHDWTGARKILDEAVRKYPDAPYVHSMLGYIELHNNNVDAAITLYKEELQKHPEDRTAIVTDLAGAYNRKQRYAEAAALLQQYRSRTDGNVLSMLVYDQTMLKDDDAALTTAREAIALHPQNYAMRTQVARILQRLHRDDEAEAAAKSAIDGTTDPGILNNNAYFLAEMKRDLPFAEEQSRKSVAMEEKATAEVAIAEANAKAFASSSQLVSAWDTLGYIIFLQGKPKEAEPYLAAAWFHAPDITKGYHLGMVYEATGQPAKALDVYRRALVRSHDSSLTSPEYEQAEKNRARLEKTAPPQKAPVNLSVLAIDNVKRPAEVSGYGVLRVQLGADGIHAVMLVKGDKSLEAVLEQVKALPMKEAVPAGSPALVLRDANLNCDKGSAECQIVLLPGSGLAAEGSSPNS
jgi:uncharacterized protein HemY